MNPPEIYHLLTRRVRIGRIVFGSIMVVACAFLGFACLAVDGKPWAVSAFCVGGIFHYAFIQMKRKEEIARKVSVEPGLVYWVHPTRLRRQLSKDAFLDCSLITLHLRDASQYEVGMASEDIRIFVGWLLEHNPSVRVGSYDDVSSQPHQVA